MIGEHLVALTAVAGHPFAQGHPDHAGLSCDVGDWPAEFGDAREEALSSGEASGALAWDIGTGLFLPDGCFDTTRRAVQGPRSRIPDLVTTTS